MSTWPREQPHPRIKLELLAAALRDGILFPFSPLQPTSSPLSAPAFLSSQPYLSEQELLTAAVMLIASHSPSFTFTFRSVLRFRSGPSIEVPPTRRSCSGDSPDFWCAIRDSRRRLSHKQQPGKAARSLSALWPLRVSLAGCLEAEA